LVVRPRAPQTRRRPTVRRLAGPVLVALAAWLSFAPPSLGADPTRLQSQVTDQVGALDGASAEIQAALDDLLDDGVQLFVLFVATTEDLSATEFAEETARLSSLGGDDALLLVALEDRSDAIWVSEGLPLTDAELDEVIIDVLEPGLRTGDFPAAVIATAEALGAAAAPATPGPTGPIVPGPIQTSPGGDPGTPGRSGIDLGLIAGLLLLVVGVALLLGWLARRLGERREADERDRRTGRLAREANATLVATDDATNHTALWDHHLYREGFEAALRHEAAGRSEVEGKAELSAQPPGVPRDEAFWLGYSEGRAYARFRDFQFCERTSDEVQVAVATGCPATIAPPH
jgi:uncharacterized membrane protein YgcG